MKPSHFLIVAVAVLLPLAAAAQDAHTTKAVNLRAGPARDYPLVASFGPGTPLAVQGCTDGFGWCDVIGPSDVRGWIYAGNIAYPYQSADVPVLGYGAELGFPIVTFTLGSYWGQYYRNRPWFGNQGRWAHHRPPLPPRPGIRPPPRPRPIVRPPISSPRPPVVRPPVVRPPGNPRPPQEGRPPSGGKPPDGRPPAGRPPEGGRPPGGEPGRPGGGDQRPQPR
ncbi:MAG: SH3 domain-containing protein [Caldimonas sp.]